ncbi:DUF6502 family protein [uncultured Roseobacter sp.]|uniref:DUF6502 family protein n=1 Tax=uncultured Roseobacter sp. TaxID=114847 RepID=UPI002604A31D|nr:DUF6502 family protein [uncultured Roseobacter sp.]
MQTPDQTPNSGFLDQALRRILKPLVRALIAKGVTAPALYTLVKQTYVDVAVDELKDDATDSRVTVMTGVHRRDVKEFRNRDPAEDVSARRKISTLSTVIGRWLSDPNYQAGGEPAVLPRFGDQSPSFEALVQSVSRDIRPRTVLDELLRQEIVSIREDQVRLELEGLVGTSGSDQKLHFFGHNLGDHMQAGVDNLLSDTSPHMERAVFYNSLSAHSVAEIEKAARDLGLEALKQINTLAAARQSEDVKSGTATHRFRFGVFFYQEDEDTVEKGIQSDDDQ